LWGRLSCPRSLVNDEADRHIAKLGLSVIDIRRCLVEIEKIASRPDGPRPIRMLPAPVADICEAGYLARKRDADATRDGIRYVRIRFSRPAIAALVEAGFLPRDSRHDADIERAVYALLNAARAAQPA
jgi:hypothetical protein